ncbi:MAG: serine hydrolase domain-containing protein [Planctomycetota bacterium]|jgi:CubicO group peptidase (beta-lactamase class C family)
MSSSIVRNTLLLLVLTPLVARAETPDTLSDAIHDRLERLMALELAPGMAVAVVRDGEVVHLRGYGLADVENGRPVTPDTVFYIASSTKSFTGTAVAILDERGVFDLEETLGGYLPRATYHEGIDPDAITMRQLLTHTHGLANNGPITFRVAYSGEHTPELLRAMMAEHGPAEHGTAFRYSNVGYNVLSMAMDDQLGKPWKDVLDEEIFQPLGMRSTTAYASRVDPARLAQPYREDPDGFSRLHYAKGDANMHAAGGLMTTASDLGRWIEANLDHGRLDGRQALPSAAIAEAHRAQAEQDGSYGPYRRTGYGLGWNTGDYEGEPMLHHFGGFTGFHAHVSFLPERGVGVVILTNSSRLGSMLAIMGAASIYDLLLEKPDIDAKFEQQLTQARDMASQGRDRIRADRERRAARPQVLPHPLATYAGTYENPVMGRVTLSVVEDRLEATMGNLWSAVEVYDATRDALRVELTGGGDVLFFDVPDGADRASLFTNSGMEFRRVE